jgi:hypothetical protein
MPSAAYPYRHPSARRAPRAAGGRRRVRWDRLGRVAMLGVLCALLFLYLSAGISLLSTWSEARHTAGEVAGLRRQYRALNARHAQLQSQVWLESQARRLGMVFPGEHQYVIRGLPER